MTQGHRRSLCANMLLEYRQVRKTEAVGAAQPHHGVTSTRNMTVVLDDLAQMRRKQARYYLRSLQRLQRSALQRMAASVRSLRNLVFITLGLIP